MTINLNQFNFFAANNPYDFNSIQNDWSINNHLKKYTTKFTGATGFNNMIINDTKNYLNLFFGPTGPGINYGGATSFNTSFNNINGVNLNNISSLLEARQLWSTIYGLTNPSYIEKYFKYRSSVTPPINPNSIVQINY